MSEAAGGEDVVLSDLEGEDPIPIESTEGVSVEKFRELVAELDRERALREAAESSKSELQVSFSRLKALAHDAIKKRDEFARQRDEALREKEEAFRAKDTASVELSEISKLKNEITRQLDEAVKVREWLEIEIENSRHMLVSGIEKISGKVSIFKNFAANGLPRSHKYNGLQAIAYGVIRRTNEIVEELVKQIDVTNKSRNEAREQMEQRNYEVAIEVSQLEATISGLRDEVAKKASLVEKLEKVMVEKEGKVNEIENDLLEKSSLVEKETLELRGLVDEYDVKLRNLESNIELQRPLLVDQLNLVAKIHDHLFDVIKIIDANHSDSELSESLFLPQQMDREENIRASLAGMESIYELTRVVVEKAGHLMEEKSNEVRALNETVSVLVKEKEHINSLLRGALSQNILFDEYSKPNEFIQAAENGLGESGIDFKFGKIIGDSKASTDRASLDKDEDEIYTLAGALENIVKESQLDIIELRHSVEELRAESRLLKEHVESQAKELNHRKLMMEELEEKERVANESIEGLMMDIAAAEEEISRWKIAAEQEAAAGRAVEQEFVAQLSTVKQELEEARQALLEAEKKLKFKEETAAAAMAAREAAEKSLSLADVRASKFRDRLEELSNQLEGFETREDSRKTRYACWPWQWLGVDFVGMNKHETQPQNSNEMELSEPLL